MVLVVTVEVMLLLGKPNSPTKNMILEETGMIGVLINIIVGAHHKPWRYLGVGIIHIMIQEIINFVLLLVVVKVVWVL